MKKESSNVMQALRNSLGWEISGWLLDDTELLETAYTYLICEWASLLKISHNERLDFLGDAVLQLDLNIYLPSPSKPEGDLSKMRLHDCSWGSLGRFSWLWFRSIYQTLARRGKSEDVTEIPSWRFVWSFFRGLAWIREWETVWNFIQQVMTQSRAGQFEQVIDYKTRLQEILQIHGDVQILMRWRVSHSCQGIWSSSVCQWKISVKDVAVFKRLQNKQQQKAWKIRWIPHVFKGNWDSRDLSLCR